MPDPQGPAPRNSQLTPEVLRQFLLRHPPSPTYWVAYSGGLDSHALLHLAAGLAQLEPRHRIRAIHVHHGLHPEADAWANHCASVCEELGIDLDIIRVDATPRRGESPEESARSARYRALQTRLGHNDSVLLAQHKDDQAETLLLQLFRGSGLNGLAGMPSHAELGNGRLLRPFLDLTRAELRRYADEHNLHWVEDSSNADVSFDRNFLRLKVLPMLHTRWPGITYTLSRSARHCAEASHLLADQGRSLLFSLLAGDGLSINIERLGTLPRDQQKLVLREWIRTAGYRLPSATVIDRVLQESLEAGTDRNPHIRWANAEFRRYRNALYLLPALPPPNLDAVLDWPAHADRLALEANGEIVITEMSEGGIASKYWARARVQVSYRAGGERLRLPGREGTHELKKLFQEAGIPPWTRKRIPLIYLDQQLASIGGLWYANEYAPVAGSSGIHLKWSPPSAQLV